GYLQLVLEGVARQRGVVHFQVQHEVILQAVLLEEANDGSGVEIVLVLGGLGRLGLDEELTRKALLAGIVAGDAQKAT
nr:hypothetical protein [Tanacetum cinerariifolium]